MFDAIAARYDRMNRVISLGLDRRWRRALVAATGPTDDGDHLLDVATGTADVALALARRHSRCLVVGMDPSRRMLAVGRRKVARAGLGARVTLQVGDVERLPHPDGRFRAATVAFGVRNFPDRPRALAELVRVVRPGGHVAVLELSEPAGGGPLSALARLHVHHLVPWLGAALSGAREYRYLQRSIAAFPPPAVFVAEMEAAGLEDVRVRPLTFGAVHVYCGRRRSARS